MSTEIINIVDLGNNNFNVHGHMTISSESLNLFWGSDNKGFQNRTRAWIMKDLNNWAVKREKREPEFVAVMFKLLDSPDLVVRLGSEILK